MRGGHKRSVLRRKPKIFAFPFVAEVRESSRDNDKMNRQIGRTPYKKKGCKA